MLLTPFLWHHGKRRRTTGIGLEHAPHLSFFSLSPSLLSFSLSVRIHLSTSFFLFLSFIPPFHARSVFFSLLSPSFSTLFVPTRLTFLEFTPPLYHPECQLRRANESYIK